MAERQAVEAMIVRHSPGARRLSGSESTSRPWTSADVPILKTADSRIAKTFARGHQK